MCSLILPWIKLFLIHANFVISNCINDLPNAYSCSARAWAFLYWRPPPPPQLKFVMGISAIAFMWMEQYLTGNKSTLTQVMAWCRQPTSHYLNQYWLGSMSPYGDIRPQWVNSGNGLMPTGNSNTPLPEAMLTDLLRCTKASWPRHPQHVRVLCANRANTGCTRLSCGTARLFRNGKLDPYHFNKYWW